MRARESRRYLGIEVAGAKNQKTVVAVLEHYPREQKVFLLDLYDKILPRHEESMDEALLELVTELRGDGLDGVARAGVNVALQLPPCLLCSKKTCSPDSRCKSPAVKWMHAMTKKAEKSRKSGQHSLRVREFTPYTQRPVELWLRYQVLPRLPEYSRFEIDETLGGNKAPLVARMTFLRRHLGDLKLTETWPKLSVAILGQDLGLSKRTLSSYRHLEEGIHAREEILEALAENHGIFIYERDIRKLAQSLGAFDAFMCAYTALLADCDRCAPVPTGFPVASGWVEYPELGN